MFGCMSPAGGLLFMCASIVKGWRRNVEVAAPRIPDPFKCGRSLYRSAPSKAPRKRMRSVALSVVAFLWVTVAVHMRYDTDWRVLHVGRAAAAESPCPSPCPNVRAPSTIIPLANMRVRCPRISQRTSSP